MNRTHLSKLILALAACLPGMAWAHAGDTKDQQLKVGSRPSGKGWVSLLNGRDLIGWKYQPEYWKMDMGVLVGFTPGTAEHHYAYTVKEYSDFELHADVKLVGNNSGVCIRIKPTSFDDVPGYQVDMGDGYWGCLWDERGRGMVAKYEKSSADRILHKDAWNHYYVRAEGHHIQMWLNGTKTVDVVDEKGNLSGPIGFQLCHGVDKKTEASFRNVYVRPIVAKPGATDTRQPAGGSGTVDAATRARIDRWIKDNKRNEYGDAPDTMYLGGTPLFDERTGRSTDRYEYILRRHPELRSGK